MTLQVNAELPDLQNLEETILEVNILMPANTKNLIKLSTQPLRPHIYKEIKNFIYNVSEVYLTEEQIEEILSKNPKLRLEIMKNDNIENVDVSDGILSAIAFHFLNRDWPDIKDHISQSNFVYQLNQKAEKMGYKVAKII